MLTSGLSALQARRSGLRLGALLNGLVCTHSVHTSGEIRTLRPRRRQAARDTLDGKMYGDALTRCRPAMTDDPFAPLPFQPDEALSKLKRRLRELRLVERQGRFEWQGRPVAEFTLEGASIRARTVKQPSSSPEWTNKLLTSSAELRKFAEEFERQCSRWRDREE